MGYKAIEVGTWMPLTDSQPHRNDVAREMNQKTESTGKNPKRLDRPYVITHDRMTIAEARLLRQIGEEHPEFIPKRRKRHATKV